MGFPDRKLCQKVGGIPAGQNSSPYPKVFRTITISPCSLRSSLRQRGTIMGYHKLNSSQLGRSSTLRVGPSLRAALLLSPGFVPRQAESPQPRIRRGSRRAPSRCRQEQELEQRQELERQELEQQEGRGGPALSGLAQAALLRHRHRWRCARNHFRGSCLVGRSTGAQLARRERKDTRTATSKGAEDQRL